MPSTNGETGLNYAGPMILTSLKWHQRSPVFSWSQPPIAITSHKLVFLLKADSKLQPRFTHWVATRSKLVFDRGHEAAKDAGWVGGEVFPDSTW